jgi:drug/metabolite transporter (DMT)-like permease
MANTKTTPAPLHASSPVAIPTDRPALAAALLVASLALLGFQDSLVKLTSDAVSLWQFQLIRSTCNLALVFLLARYYRGGFHPYPKRIWAVALRSLFLVCAMIFYFGAIPFLSLSQIAAGYYVFPIFVALLSNWILKEKVGPRRVVAIIAGFLGTLLILKPGTADFELYALMPIGAGLCFAANILTIRKLCREENPVALTLGAAIAFIIASVLGLVITSFGTPMDLAVRWPYVFTGWHPIGWLVFSIIIACSFLNLTANLGLAKAYQSADSSWLAPFDYSFLVFATFWSIVMWDDIPDILSVLGMVIIAGAGGYVAWRQRIEQDLQKAKTGA